MKRNILTSLGILSAIAIAGCSTSRHHATRVSYVEPVPVSYHHTDSYTDTTPAFDRTYVATDTTTQYAKPQTSVITQTARTRTVAMPAGSIRHDITLDEFRDHTRNRSAVIVDARLPKDFNKGHVRGAINIPAGDEDRYLEKFRKDVSPDELIIVYCGGPDCPAGDNVATYLAGQGFTNIRVYAPGWQQLSNTDLR